MTTIQVVSMASFNKLSQVLSGGRHRLACVVQSLQSMAFKAYTQWLSRALQGLPHCDTLRRALRSRTPRPFPTQAQPLLMPGEVAAADQRASLSGMATIVGAGERPPPLAYVAAQRWPRLQQPSARRRVGSDMARRPMGEQCPPMPGRQVAAAARDPTHGCARLLLDARAPARAPARARPCPRPPRPAPRAPRPRPCRLRTRGAAVTGARRHWRASAGRPAQRLRGRVQRCPPRPHTPSTLS